MTRQVKVAKDVALPANIRCNRSLLPATTWAAMQEINETSQACEASGDTGERMLC